MIAGSVYAECVGIVTKAKASSVECVFVFKPDDGEGSPDMIVCTSSDPNVIAALLGNFPVGGSCGNDDDNNNDD